METVKVDIQKLQLLNDRIAQMIDALNQVRMSVQQGIQHSAGSPFGYGSPYGGYVAPQQFLPYGTQFASQYQTPYPTPFFGGIQHTAPFLAQQTTPWFGTPTTSPVGAFSIPYAGNGLSHTTWDPSWQARAQQSWPFVTS